jgi:DNA excision repair protein ERCC-4
LIPIPLFKIHSSDASVSNKRLDLYSKGGVFSVTYKILILDLLTKKLSPSIISGLIINNAHKANAKGAGNKTGEAFLAEIIR